MARACSIHPRRTMTAATSAKGTIRSEKVSPANTRASSQPSNASRPMPTREANTPIATVAAMRRRTPRVNCQSRWSKNMEGARCRGHAVRAGRRAGIVDIMN